MGRGSDGRELALRAGGVGGAAQAQLLIPWSHGALDGGGGGGGGLQVAFDFDKYQIHIYVSVA